MTGALQELARLLMTTDSLQELLQQIAALAVRSVTPAVTCGITMANAGRVITVAAADATAALLDEQQYELDEGPCLEALYTATIVDAPDLTRENRWGSYPQRALAHGVSAVYSSPLIAHGETIGALNLYANSPHAFDSDNEHDVVAQVTALTELALTTTLRTHGDATLTTQLQTALNSRSVIDQAVGIVMATQRCTAEQAFAILRGVSQTRNIRLARIAEDLVSRTADVEPTAR